MKLQPSVLWRALGYLRPYLACVLPAGFILAVNSLIVAAVPQFIRLIVDRGIAERDLLFLGRATAGLLAMNLVKGGLSFVQGRLVEIASQGVAYDLRREIHERLTALSFSFHDKSQAGQLLSRAVQDVERIRFLTGRALLRLVEGSVLTALTAGMIAWMNPRLSVLAVAVLPLLIWRTIRYGGLIRPLSQRILDQLGVLTSRLDQNLRGIRVVKAFAQEAAEIDRFLAENRTWFDLSARQGRLAAVQGPMLTLIVELATVLVIAYGGFLIIQGRLTYGELVAFIAYLAQLGHPVRLLGMLAPVVGTASSAGERIFDIIDARSEVEDAPTAEHVADLRGEVEFHDVSFAYEHRAAALENVSFKVKAGSIVALLGATGSGKSTIVNLIPRFYEVGSGFIAIDGRDLKSFTLRSLRAGIGIVAQDTTLFATTIRENIAFGSPTADDEAIINAAKAAEAHDFIMAAPSGYDTMVGERGITLSGGQKQRLAIARALLKDPRILILDDATSSVDAETEHRIQIAMERLMTGRTSFIIAQRLSTVRKADLVIVMDRGRIAAMGTHEELSAGSQAYRDLVQRRLSGAQA